MIVTSRRRRRSSSHDLTWLAFVVLGGAAAAASEVVNSLFSLCVSRLLSFQPGAARSSPFARQTKSILSLGVIKIY